jgi:hypothetical protein
LQQEENVVIGVVVVVVRLLSARPSCSSTAILLRSENRAETSRFGGGSQTYCDLKKCQTFSVDEAETLIQLCGRAA